uniref:Uncharacterized protein n=1 Tax=Anguilla anguilla TaxID=7936 RepID=A0A0E9R322_ANGAN
MLVGDVFLFVMAALHPQRTLAWLQKDCLPIMGTSSCRKLCQSVHWL